MGVARRAASGAFGYLAAGALALLCMAAPATAQKVPDATSREMIIKTTLLTFNDANITGNYAVLHAKLAKPFRDQFSPERLKEAFKAFADKHIDIDIIAAKAPVASQESRVTDKGVLMLYGYFDAAPNRVNYELEFIMSDGDWKPIKLNVDIK